MIEKMFNSSQNFVTILRTCEHSPVLKFFLVTILEEMRNKMGSKKSALDKENPEDIEMHEFLMTLPQATYLQSYLKKNTDSFDDQLEFTQGILNLSQTQFVRREQAAKGECVEVN